jgi:hypothetical protein
MDSFDASDHAFVIRIWKESREIEGASPTWRGVIEHVRSGQKQYLRDFSTIASFIIPYLEAMGTDTQTLRRWIEQCHKLQQSLRQSGQPDE